MRKRAASVAVILLFLGSAVLSPSSALGGCDQNSLLTSVGGGEYLRWRSCAAIPYSINPPAEPSGASNDVSAAVAAWDATSDQFSFYYGGCEVRADGSPKECGEFDFNNWDGDELKAHCHTWTNSAGTLIVGFRIHFNFYNYPGNQWTTGCQPGLLNIQSRAVHEVGHALGLARGSDLPCGAGDPTVMKPASASYPCWSQPDTWDVGAIATAYTSANLLVNTEALASTCDSNPAAIVEKFNVQDGVASWSVSHEWNTVEYLVEGCRNLNGAGQLLAREAPFVGEHFVSLPDNDYEWCRLVEVDSYGRRNPKSVAPTTQIGAKKPLLQIEEVLDREGQGHSASSRDVVAAMQNQTTVSEPRKCIVFALQHLTGLLEDEFANYWADWGYDVQIVDVPIVTSGGSAAPLIKNSIRSYYLNQGITLFHLVGDWRDDYMSPLWHSSPYWQSMFDDYLAHGKIPNTPPPEISVLPTFLIPDAILEDRNTAYWLPYIYSDTPYADIDDDGIPDVVVTRWPFRDAGELGTVLQNMQNYPAYESAVVPNKVALLSGNLQFGDRGFIVNQMTEQIEEQLSGTSILQVHKLFESDFPEPSDRNVVTKSLLNAQHPDIVSILSANSNYFAPGFFFWMGDPAYNFWATSVLSPGWFVRAIVAASCGSAKWAPWSDNDDLIACKDFLRTANRGTIAWIGPTTGTLQNANYVVESLILEELCASPYRPMAESWLVAMKRAYQVFANAPDYLPTLDAYVFLGDPLSPLLQLPECTIVASALPTAGPPMGMPANAAVGCPLGDQDRIVIEINLDGARVMEALPREALTISQPINGSVLLFPENIAIHADSATTLVPATADYRTTFTIGSFSGCGIDSALVSLYGMPLGYAHLNVKSRDVVCPSPPNPSRGKVDLLDFGTLGASYTSPPKPYNPCVDYVAAFGQINVGDFAAFGAHWNHSASGGGSAPESASIVVSGTVALEFEESHPLLGEHTLRATMSLEGVPAFKAAMFALRNENPKLEFMGWMEASGYPGETMTTETIRDGRREVFIGVLDADATEGDVVLGTAEFRVVSDQQLALTDDDLALVTADLLSNTDQRSTLALSSLAVRRAVTSVEYKNELAQNYPNPFNPTTTISFSLAQTADASLSIYDVRGALVKSLYNGRAERGIHRIVWDGTSNGGQQVASGVYFYKLTAGSFADTKKMTILK